MDELDFEWSPDEKLEYYCQKILKNLAEEEMNPIVNGEPELVIVHNRIEGEKGVSAENSVLQRSHINMS